LTFEEWDACDASGACKHQPWDQGWGRGRQPVVNVGWDDAERYISWLTKRTGQPYRFLSEAEWEWAARAGTETPFSWGDSPGRGNANCNGCGSPWDNKQSAPVGSFAPNAFGLYYMHGNVWEWVQDCGHGQGTEASYDGAPTDGSAWMKPGCNGTRHIRSGSFLSNPLGLRSAIRSRLALQYRSYQIGIRIGRTLNSDSSR
jgi:formylglycine-generating enzyme required for sulfatase activity